MRFLFGLQALTLLLAISSFLWLPRAIQSPQLDGLAEFVILVLAAYILNLVPTIAWWKLRRGRQDARLWAIAASVLCLPLPFPGIVERAQRIAHSWTVFARILHFPPQLLELAVGMAGLAVFLPSGASAPATAEPKLERIAGDGTSKFWGYAFQAFITVGVVAASVWWPRWGGSQGLESPSFSAWIPCLVVALFLEICCHELGHFTAGALCGRKLRMFHVGPFRWQMRNGKWEFEFSPKLSLSGSVVLVPRTLEHFRRNKAVELAGGPLASLSLGAAGLATLWISRSTSWRPSWFLFATITSVSAMSFFANLIPQRTKLFYSDGAQLYQILSNGLWGKVHLALGMAGTSLLSSIRPRDWDIGLINEAADFLKTGIQGMVLRIIASHYYLDSGNIPEAVASMNDAASLFSEQAIRKPADFYAGFVFMNAFYARNLPAAEAWWLKLQPLGKIDYDADYWLARSSILWLSGDPTGARQAWERGDERARRLPSSGIYDFTRWKFAELGKALDQDAPADPQAPAVADPLIAAL